MMIINWIIYIFLSTLVLGQVPFSISGDIINLDHNETRNCPSYVDSCIYVCDSGISNPCHPENLFPIEVNTSSDGEITEGSRYRIFFPWTHEGMTANKFIVTASSPCLSPTAVYASGNLAYWDLYGNDNCPGTVQGSIWYGDNCEDEEGNIGSTDCIELIGRFCFVVGDTLSWSIESDQSVSTDICNSCWMSAPAWSYYDSLTYSDPQLSPEPCEVYDHCHHSSGDGVLCGIGFLDYSDTSTVNIVKDGSLLSEYLSFSNYPNPFNPFTVIEYEIPVESEVSIAVYDILGKEIRSLISQYVDRGRHFVRWDGTDDKGRKMPSGMYISAIKIQDKIQRRKMLLLR